MIQSFCADNEHEFTIVEMSSNYNGVINTFKQCRKCGKFLEGSVKYNQIPIRGIDAIRYRQDSKNKLL